jgi:chromate transporter
MSVPAAEGEAGSAPNDHGVPFSEAFRTWLRIAVLSFGGPVGQIALMHRIVVEEKRWIGESRFLHALNYCMLLPGPEAQQLAVYIGWLMHRTPGGLVAGTLFILPGFVSILALSYVYVAFGHIGVVEGLFFGLKAAVLAIVAHALARIGKRVLNNGVMISVATAAFVAIFLFDVPFPMIVLAAAIIGYTGAKAGLLQFRARSNHGNSSEAQLADADSVLGEAVPAHIRPNLAWSVRISAVFLVLWLVPVAALFLLLGAGNVYSQIGLFFSQLAVVTFGGAYAVLSYVAQEAVLAYGWLKPEQMLDGLGLAETTPGPLIMVVQFVGFLGAYKNAGTLDPMLAGTLGAILTTWVTFVPCFLWIFLGAPFIEKLRSNAELTGAMSAITAAVVGVILNLAIWFALHSMFEAVSSVHLWGMRLEIPSWSSVNWPAIVLALAAMFGLFQMQLPVWIILVSSAAVGIAWTSVGRM